MTKIITSHELINLKNKIIIDVRSPIEFEEYHIYGAINIPLFTDEQRAEIGTIYKKESSTAAKKRGATLIASRFAEIVGDIIDYTNEYENVVMYCHRGGMRSKSITALLTSLDLKNVYKLEGGIKKHRNYVMNNILEYLNSKEFIVLHGLTGVGKTKLLQSLESKNFDVLDYEGLANNAGSVFGNILYRDLQPTQKQFEEDIFGIITNSKSKYIFIESESKRVGSVSIPDEYMQKLTEGVHILVSADIDVRTEVLISDYSNEDNHESVIKCIDKLRKRLGNEKADKLVELTKKDELNEMVKILLIDYYDPLYNFSINKYLPYDHNVKYKDTATATEELISILRKIEGN